MPLPAPDRLNRAGVAVFGPRFGQCRGAADERADLADRRGQLRAPLAHPRGRADPVRPGAGLHGRPLRHDHRHGPADLRQDRLAPARGHGGCGLSPGRRPDRGGGRRRHPRAGRDLGRRPRRPAVGAQGPGQERAPAGRRAVLRPERAPVPVAPAGRRHHQPAGHRPAGAGTPGGRSQPPGDHGWADHPHAGGEGRPDRSRGP